MKKLFLIAIFLIISICFLFAYLNDIRKDKHPFVFAESDRTFLYQKKEIFLKYYDLCGSDNDSDSSLVYSARIGSVSFLFTGDISSDMEKELLYRYGPMKIDILKVSHHGSYTSSSRYFISSILTRFAIISTSGRYGHPHDIVLSILDDYKVKYYVTRDDGTITFSFSRFLDFITTGKGEFVIIS